VREQDFIVRTISSVRRRRRQDPGRQLHGCLQGHSRSILCAIGIQKSVAEKNSNQAGPGSRSASGSTPADRFVKRTGTTSAHREPGLAHLRRCRAGQIFVRSRRATWPVVSSSGNPTAVASWSTWIAGSTIEGFPGAQAAFRGHVAPRPPASHRRPRRRRDRRGGDRRLKARCSERSAC